MRVGTSVGHLAEPTVLTCRQILTRDSAPAATNPTLLSTLTAFLATDGSSRTTDMRVHDRLRWIKVQSASARSRGKEAHGISHYSLAITPLACGIVVDQENPTDQVYESWGLNNVGTHIGAPP
jgi:hypothetical protein